MGTVSNSTFGFALEKTSVFSAITELIEKVDSVEDDYLSNFFKEKVFVAGVLTGGEQLNYLISLEANGFTNDQVLNYVNKIFGAQPTSSKDYDLNIIYTYSMNGLDVCFSKIGGVVLFSTSSILIEEGIRELAAERHLQDNTGFKKLFKTADVSSDGNFFINLRNIGAYLNLFGDNAINFAQSMQNLGGWAELDLNAKDQSLMFNGFSFMNDSTFSYLKSFEGEPAQALGVSSVLPENTGVLSYLSYGSFESFKKKYDKELKTKYCVIKMC